MCREYKSSVELISLRFGIICEMNWHRDKYKRKKELMNVNNTFDVLIPNVFLMCMHSAIKPDGKMTEIGQHLRYGSENNDCLHFWANRPINK